MHTLELVFLSLSVSKACSVQYLTVLCFPWQLGYQDAKGRCVWSPPLGLLTWAWCSGDTSSCWQNSQNPEGKWWLVNVTLRDRSRQRCRARQRRVLLGKGCGGTNGDQSATNQRAARHLLVALSGIFIVKHSLALHCSIKMQNEQMPRGLKFLIEIS